MSFFGFGAPKLTPKEQMREWTNGLRKEKRHLEREVMKIEREETKIKSEIKKEAKAGHTKATKILAKSYLKSQRCKEKLLIAATQINSVILQLKTNAATLNVVGVMEKSTHVMEGMSKLVRIPQVRAVAAAMAKEMAKAGIVEEIMEDAMSVMDDEGLEEEADQEVEKALSDILAGQMSGVDALKARVAAEEVEDEKDEKHIDEMKLRLKQLES